MNEERCKLLMDYGVLVLPEEIEHSTYELMLEALLMRPDQPIRLYCRGDGGSSFAALAIVDLMHQHGQVLGLLPSAVASSHAIIWAGCAKRYVYPLGYIGLHKVAWNSIDTRSDSTSLRLLAKEYERTERVGADILAAASNKEADYWYDLMQEAGSGSVCILDAKQLIEVEMARPICELG